MPKRVFTTGKTTWKAIRNTHQKDKESNFIVTQKRFALNSHYNFNNIIPNKIELEDL